MTNGGQRPDPSGFRIENEMDLLFGRAHPNPTRVGCPPPELLKKLARRELPIDDPAYDHFAKCSPCYQELRALQQADATNAGLLRRRRMAFATAAILVLALTGSWFALRRGDSTTVPMETSEPAPQVASLDLRPLAVTRSEDQKSAKPLEVPRGRVKATILLPVGSSPGAYEIRILDSDLRVRANAKGLAEVRNYVTTLEAAFDTSVLEVGDYQLTLRREGGEWQMFPLQLR
jgi:hypothetical protein